MPRPVAGSDLSASVKHEEVSEYERQYEDGSDPRVLDVIDIPMLERKAKGYQTENWLLDPDYYWEKVGKLSWFDLPDAAGRRGAALD